MRFWDSSALVTLHIAQASSRATRALYRGDPQVVAWILSDVEMRSALARLEREGAMAPADAREAVSRVEVFWQAVHVISMIDPVKARAKQLLAVHPLRAADALQLAAALVYAYDDPPGREFVCLDDRLSDAARREGFTVAP